MSGFVMGRGALIFLDAIAALLLARCTSGFQVSTYQVMSSRVGRVSGELDDSAHFLYSKQKQHDNASSFDIPSVIQTSRADIRVILDTDHLLVLDKPAGIPHHSNEEEQGILACVREALGPSAPRLYGVHRLDRVTSGILVLAKDAPTARSLTKAFRSGAVAKYYTAISQRKAKKKQGLVQGGMQRGRRKSWLLTRDSGQDTVNFAKTRFYTASLGGLRQQLGQTSARMDPKTLILFRPFTGRTHQLRVAAKSVGLPIAGDPTYRDGFDMAPRTYLHATGLYIPADTDSRDDLVVWCHPPYHHLWNKDGGQGFESALQTLVDKHCDIKELADECKWAASTR